MRIGILTSRGRGDERGGAERFYEGLCCAFNDRGFRADTVAIPSDESTFDAIQETYLRCYDFDATSFDAVVSTKAPTYLVRHRNHVCYLVHTIRVFYDMFDATFPAAVPQLYEQRSLIHRMDTLALAPPRTRRVFAIGHEVARRLKETNGIDAAVLHPPLGFEGFHRGRYDDYVFVPGRLHKWKRVDLVIRAMREVRAPLRLLIAGTGEDEAALRSLAAGDERIEFLGRVSDTRLIDLYANALAIAFVPLREDYGYVTVEAFRSGKPVVTCNDSGEAAVLVQHEQSGLVVEPDPRNIAAAFERLHADPAWAAKLGAAGAAREALINWDNVVPVLAAAMDPGGRKAA